jgi:hypothetical protein
MAPLSITRTMTHGTVSRSVNCIGEGEGEAISFSLNYVTDWVLQSAIDSVVVRYQLHRLIFYRSRRRFTMLAHSSEVDDREPLFTLSAPELFGEYFNGRYGVYSFSLVYWVDLLAFIALQVLVASVTGIILYKVVIEPRAYESTFSLMLVYGVILPFWISMPFYTIRFFDVRNLVFKFIVGVITPTLSIFRATEGKCPARILHA